MSVVFVFAIWLVYMTIVVALIFCVFSTYARVKRMEERIRRIEELIRRNATGENEP